MKKALGFATVGLLAIGAFAAHRRIGNRLRPTDSQADYTGASAGA